MVVEVRGSAGDRTEKKNTTRERRDERVEAGRVGEVWRQTGRKKVGGRRKSQERKESTKRKKRHIKTHKVERN